VGIGINTGELVAGYIGSSRTMSFSVIGDTVNTASRLCSAAKPGQIIISASTSIALPVQIAVGALAPLKAKGKFHPIEVFEVLGYR
jgi:adenylate cyclase